MIGKFRNFFNPFIWPIIVDIIIIIVCSVFLLYSIYLAAFQTDNFMFFNIVISILPLIYSIYSTSTKKREASNQLSQFSKQLEPFLETCNNIILLHCPYVQSYINEINNKVININFKDWKKYQSIRPIEYQILISYLDHIAERFMLNEEDVLFLQYIFITSNFPHHFATLKSNIINGDFYKPQSIYNLFINKISVFIENNEPLHKISITNNLTNQEIESTLNILLSSDSSTITDLLKEKKRRDQLGFLLQQCFENAYTTAGNLNLMIQDEDSNKFTLLYKYDERYSILKRKLNYEIDQHFEYNKSASGTPESVKKAINELMYPLPLSKAISDFSYCIEKISNREKFLFVIYPTKFAEEYYGWTSEKFMKEIVVERARQHQENFNQSVITKFPYLKNQIKKTLDTNYYLFEFSRNNFKYNAVQSAMPIAIKRFLIRDILESENAGEIISTQLIYLKQIVNHLSISGLLFTEEKKIQEKIQKIETKLLRQLSIRGIIINNIYEIATIGNQQDEFEYILHELLHKTKLKRKYGIKYFETKNITEIIISNAKDLISIFTPFQTFENSQQNNDIQ